MYSIKSLLQKRLVECLWPPGPTRQRLNSEAFFHVAVCFLSSLFAFKGKSTFHVIIIVISELAPYSVPGFYLCYPDHLNSVEFNSHCLGFYVFAISLYKNSNCEFCCLRTAGLLFPVFPGRTKCNSNRTITFLTVAHPVGGSPWSLILSPHPHSPPFPYSSPPPFHSAPTSAASYF